MIAAYRELDYTLTGFPEREALRLNAIESCAAGTPVLAPAAPPFSETMRDGVTGFLYTDPRRDGGADFERVLTGIECGTLRPYVDAAAMHLHTLSFDRFVDRVDAAFAVIAMNVPDGDDKTLHGAFWRYNRAAAKRDPFSMLTAKTFVIWQAWQLWAAAVYFALLPSNAWTALRSVGFGASSFMAMVLLIGAWTGRGPRVPYPGHAIVVTLALWCAWSVASLFWSVDVDYSALEAKREIGWSLLAIVAFYVAPHAPAAWRALVGVALAAFALSATLVLGATLTPSGWDPARWHSGVGPYATHVVLVAPLLLTLLAPPPVGFGSRTRNVAIGVAMLVLLLVSARLTDNRVVWIALAVVYATASTLAAWRWQASLARAPMRWLSPLFALLIVLGVVFADVTRERAQLDFPPQTSVAQTLSEDPRIPLWDRTAQLIRERPWTGYGFGRAIVAEKLKVPLGNPMLWHAHNLFVGQILQTGTIGLLLFVALLLALCARFVHYLRHEDDALAVIGVVGLSLIAGFVTKNMTDDFLFRSNAKEFWALLALLVGFGTRLEEKLDTASGESAVVHVRSSVAR